MKVGIVGFGDLGHYMKTVLQEYEGVHEEDFAYFDDVYRDAGGENAFAFQDHADDAFKDLSFYVCLGYKHLRVKNDLIGRLVDLGRAVPPFVSESAWVHSSVELGPGAFIYPGCDIDRGTKIGRGSWIANGDVIAHDCEVGACCWFGASVTLCGKVSVGGGTFIGSGTTVSNDVHVGSDVIVGLGTAVTRDVEDGSSVIGNPMRTLDRPIELV
ncbi:MAG: hypothetical protein AAF430_12080 [Myxococcota bacterium]